MAPRGQLELVRRRDCDEVAVLIVVADGELGIVGDAKLEAQNSHEARKIGGSKHKLGAALAALHGRSHVASQRAH